MLRHTNMTSTQNLIMKPSTSILPARYLDAQTSSKTLQNSDKHTEPQLLVGIKRSAAESVSESSEGNRKKIKSEPVYDSISSATVEMGKLNLVEYGISNAVSNSGAIKTEPTSVLAEGYAEHLLELHSESVTIQKSTMPIIDKTAQKILSPLESNHTVPVQTGLTDELRFSLRSELTNERNYPTVPASDFKVKSTFHEKNTECSPTNERNDPTVPVSDLKVKSIFHEKSTCSQVSSPTFTESNINGKFQDSSFVSSVNHSTDVYKYLNLINPIDNSEISECIKYINRIYPQIPGFDLFVKKRTLTKNRVLDLVQFNATNDESVENACSAHSLPAHVEPVIKIEVSEEQIIKTKTIEEPIIKKQVGDKTITETVSIPMESSSTSNSVPSLKHNSVEENILSNLSPGINTITKNKAFDLVQFNTTNDESVGNACSANSLPAHVEPVIKIEVSEEQIVKTKTIEESIIKKKVSDKQIIKTEAINDSMLCSDSRSISVENVSIADPSTEINNLNSSLLSVEEVEVLVMKPAASNDSTNLSKFNSNFAAVSSEEVQVLAIKPAFINATLHSNSVSPYFEKTTTTLPTYELNNLNPSPDSDDEVQVLYVKPASISESVDSLSRSPYFKSTSTELPCIKTNNASTQIYSEAFRGLVEKPAAVSQFFRTSSHTPKENNVAIVPHPLVSFDRLVEMEAKDMNSGNNVTIVPHPHVSFDMPVEIKAEDINSENDVAIVPHPPVSSDRSVEIKAEHHFSSRTNSSTHYHGKTPNSINTEVNSKEIGSVLQTVVTPSKDINDDPPKSASKNFTSIFSERRGSQSSLSKCLYKNVGKNYIGMNDLPSLILEWNTNWLLTQKESQKCPPICDNYNRVKYTYKNELDYYNTYFPLHLLNIWLRISESWKRPPTVFDSVYESQVEKPNFVKIACSTVLCHSMFQSWPRREDVLLCRTLKPDGRIGKELFGRICNVVASDYNPPSNSSLQWKAGTLNMVKFEFFCAEALHVSHLVKVQIQILDNIRIPLLQNDALTNLNPVLKDLILNPNTHRSDIEFISLQCQRDPDYPKRIKSIIDSVMNPNIRVTVIDTLSSWDSLFAISVIVVDLIKKGSPVLIGLRSEDSLVQLARLLKHDFILAVKKKELKLPEELKKFTLEERSELLPNRDIFNKYRVILTLTTSVFMGDFGDVFAKQNLTCILHEAQLCTETESALLLYYDVETLVLMGRDGPCADIHPVLRRLGYDISLFSRFCTAK